MREEVLILTKQKNKEICAKVPCVKEEEERAPEILKFQSRSATNRRKASGIRKTLKLNEKLSLVLSKSTDLLQEMVLQKQRQATIHDFLGNNVKTQLGHLKKCKIYVEYYTSLLF